VILFLLGLRWSRRLHRHLADAAEADQRPRPIVRRAVRADDRALRHAAADRARRDLDGGDLRQPGRAFGLPGAAVGWACIAAVAAATLLSFLATPIITRILGRIGLTIVVRVLGLILCALAVQFILAGLADSTCGFIRPSAANPVRGLALRGTCGPARPSAPGAQSSG
jgi:multiple antibiotic resistance protein